MTDPSWIQAGMAEALRQATLSRSQGGIPIGSALQRAGEIVAAGHNQRVQQDDPILHAEMDCLRNAGRQRTYRDTVIYSTLMPCYMCAGAIIQFRVPIVVAGESITFPGASELMRSHGVEVIDLADSRCRELMQAFIAENPTLWNEDIGE